MSKPNPGSGGGVAEYLRDNYGECSLGSPRCLCLKPGHAWLGADCPTWRPWGVQTLAELAEHQRKANAA